MFKADTTLEQFMDTVNDTKKKCRNSGDWIDWHLLNDVDRCIFPVRRDSGIKGSVNNTNGQEGDGCWVKQGYGSSKERPDLEKALAYLFCHAFQIHLNVLVKTVEKDT